VRIVERIVWPVAVAAVIAGFAVSVWMIFIYTSIEPQIGFSQKIFYFHVPSAWIAYMAFAVAAVGSVIYLIKRNVFWDALAFSSIETGMVFTTLVLITGPLWARPAWGAYWVWDARLTTTLILWLIQVTYLLLRAYIDEREKAAKYSAILALLGALDIPLVHYSVVLWRGMHPSVMHSGREGGGQGMPPEFTVALMVSLVTFTILFFLLLAVRTRLELARMRLNGVRQQVLEHGANR
jgi:heme exporter protein C